VTELLLSLPVPRSAYYLGKFAGHALVACCLALVFTAPLALFAPGRQAAFWGLSLACELLIMTAVSLFCVISLTQVLPALAASAGFYLLGRSVEAMQVIAATPVGASEAWTDAAVRWIVDAIALLMPALDRMTLTRWLLEAPPSTGELANVLLQTVIYVVLIGAASMFDLYRKNF
jgi:Cu-processing system permease protein